MSEQTLKDRVFLLQSYQPVYLATVLENQQSRYTLNAKARGRQGIGVDVEFTDKDTSGEFGRELFDDRCDHPTWTAPRRPKIKQYGNFRRSDDVTKIRIRNEDWFCLFGWKRLVAFAAYGLFSRSRTIGQAIARAARCASYNSGLCCLGHKRTFYRIGSSLAAAFCTIPKNYGPKDRRQLFN